MPGGLENIAAVDTGGVDSDERFARSRRGVVGVGPRQRGWVRGVLLNNCLHDVECRGVGSSCAGVYFDTL